MDRPPGLLTSVERCARAQDPAGTKNVSVKLLPKTEGPFCVSSDTNITVLIDQDGVENRVSIDHLTKIPRGLWDAVTPAATAETEAEKTVPRAEYVVECIVGYRTRRSGIH